jgi:arginine exporter protein ArgO
LTSSKRFAVVLTVLAVSLLHPAAYLDTLLIIGGGALRYEPSLKLYYASGAILATVLRFLDGLTGVMMWWVATQLLLHVF